MHIPIPLSRKRTLFVSSMRMLARMGSLLVALQAASRGVTVIQRLPGGMGYYVKTTTHPDGSIDMQAYKRLGFKAPFHATIDAPVFQTRGQQFPVTLGYHVNIADDVSEYSAKLLDSSGANAILQGTGKDWDGTTRTFTLKVSSGVVNGTATQTNPQSGSTTTESISNLPVNRLSKYTRSFKLLPPSTGRNVGLEFDPSTMSARERQAWQINQEIVRNETLHKSNVKPAIPSDCKTYSDAASATEQQIKHDRAYVAAWGPKTFTAQDFVNWNRMIASEIERVGKMQKEFAKCMERSR